MSDPPGLTPRRRRCRGGAMVSDPEGADTFAAVHHRWRSPSSRRPTPGLGFRDDGYGVSGEFTIAAECAAEVIPAIGVASHWGRRLPATGCDGSNSSTRQATGAWKAGPVLGDLVQEARSDRSRSSAGYVGHDAGCCEGSHAVACFPGNRTGARQPSTDRDTNRRTRVPEGAMGPRRSQGARKALGRPARPPGAVATPPSGRQVRHPRPVALFLLTLAERECQEETARAQVDGRRERRRARQSACGARCAR